jgi:hypothetical protein
LNNAGLLGLSRVEMLRKVQEKVMKLECLQQGANGIYDKSNGAEQTYCNHAVYLTIQAVDGNYKQFLGNPDLYKRDDPPSLWEDPYNGDPLNAKFREEIKDEIAKYTNGVSTSHIWCDILEKQAKNSATTGICKLDIDKVQEYADMGYVVIGARKDVARKHPHYVTVCPEGKYTKEGGPTVAHVGAGTSAYKPASEAFSSSSLSPIQWYYNEKQEFIKNFDAIEILKKRIK